ncbi:E3 ubiquitin-protein ligase RMA1 [Diplonema papillatum]|nr:E3 ubiquitin-protein ligase RMA1 [Diplonema papillatum]
MSGTSDDTDFDCGICMDKARDPVVTQCGHLFCWHCLGKWLDHGHADCPICKAACARDSIIPLYGKGKANPSNSASEPSEPRPQANRPPTPPPRSEFFSFGFHSYHPFGTNDPQQPITWDETKSRFFLYIGLLIILYLFISPSD